MFQTGHLSFPSGIAGMPAELSTSLHSISITVPPLLQDLSGAGLKPGAFGCWIRKA